MNEPLPACSRSVHVQSSGPACSCSYFPTAAFYASRLHVFGADRYHPAYSRWSIGLHPNGSTDGGWRVEQPSLPEGLGG